MRLTWLVSGPVLIILSCAKGGWASMTTVAPISFSVYQTCFPSGVAAMFGQKGLGCGTLATWVWLATSNTTSSAVKDEQTKPERPSGEQIVMPGPLGVLSRAFSA